MDMRLLLFELLVRGAAIGFTCVLLTPIILIGALFSKEEPYWKVVLYQYRNIAIFWGIA